ncbi:TRAP transporter large permease [Sinirhodobacter sp. WL0062]|uniref:TRAP transporter large permease protein n=1 Tax=Rhodobacter flavimaris TaxID=2907145 RepID=A0ABS8YUD4_9RHOB|nr:TRAP transporter large permease [Sinirhodobacter sp. WL0062]MCE5973088.1 TRAP transporter large permease [Sinirhodobacter sp. WL0062]
MSFAFVVCLAVLFGVAALGTPIGYAMLVASIAYLAISGSDLSLAAEQLIQNIYSGYILLAVPLFIVAANIMNAGSISDRLLAFCIALVGRFRGGMGYVNIVVSLIFAGMSGSAVADAAGPGKMMISMMTKGGHYTKGFAAGITAASATIGPIVPPSIPMVMYALVSDQSIGYLFLGGVVPGFVMAIMLAIMNFALTGRAEKKREPAVPLREIPRLTLRAIPVLFMPVILLGGIYGGATTPTEAAAIAALYALLLAMVFYRQLSLKGLAEVFSESARQAATVGIVIGSALIFNYIVAAERIPDALASFLEGREIGPVEFMIGVNILLLLLGMLLDGGTIILVVLPLFIPAARAVGIDMIHFGVVAVVNTMIGLVTPPYGILIFVINAVTGISIKEIVAGILPFLGALIIALVVLAAFPDLVLYLPRLFGYEG